jgi:uncharacterized phosphatase
MKDSFYFLRHAQTDWNVENLIMGKKDIPLNEIGRKQAVQAAKILAGYPFASLCYSPLLRSKETAEIIASLCPCSLYSLDELQERGWGEWEGLAITYEEMLEMSEEEIPIGAEPHDLFLSRVRKGLTLAASYPSPVLFVSHGGVFEVICKECGVNFYDIPNAAVIHFERKLGKWQTERLTL